VGERAYHWQQQNDQDPPYRRPTRRSLSDVDQADDPDDDVRQQENKTQAAVDPATSSGAIGLGRSLG
jgi:hypothetical protein